MHYPMPSADDVARRYAPLFDDLEVVAIPLNDKGKTLFVLEGVRNARTTA